MLRYCPSRNSNKKFLIKGVAVGTKIKIALLGEIKLASYFHSSSDGSWYVIQTASNIPDSLLANEFSSEELCQREIKLMIPEPCREYVKFFNN